MTPENRNIPDWAHRDLQADFACIRGNLEVFWPAATIAYEDAGRGAIVVDTTLEPIPGAGNPFAYFPQERLKDQADDDTKRILSEYDPTEELVLVLLKSDNHTSTYRVGGILPGPQGTVADKVSPSRNNEPPSQPGIEMPDVETLIEWEADGGCEAGCPHHC